MIQVNGKLEGVTKYYGDCLIHGVVIDGAPRWNIMDIVKVVFEPLGITGEEFVEMLTETIPPDDLFSCELKDNPLPFLGTDFENVENLIQCNDIDDDGFLCWLELLDKMLQEHLLSHDNSLVGYLTPGCEALLDTIEALGFELKV